MATRKTRKGKKTAKITETPENGSGLDSYGTVSQETQSAIGMMRQRTEGMIVEIGRMELRKSRFLAQIEELDQAASRMLRQEAQALGIPDDKPWRMTAEGEAVRVQEGA
jgi:hypothetical protein